MKKRWFTLKNIQNLVDLSGVQVVKFTPCMGDWSKNRRPNNRIRGVHLGFPNGVTLSVQWGTANWCDNGVTTCEVIAKDEGGKAICIPHYLIPEHIDQMVGYVDQDDLLKIIKECAGITEKIRKEMAPVI